MKLIDVAEIESSMGTLLVATDDRGNLCSVEFADHRQRMHRLLRQQHGEYRIAISPGAETTAAARIKSYLDGDLSAISDLGIGTQGSLFEEQVWSELRRIPVGTTTTYGQIARDLGHTDPRMAKEVGAAVGANPVQIVVPCHRVIGAGGELKGYAGGTHRKEWLLPHEGVRLPSSKSPRGRGIQQQDLEFLASE